MSRRDERQAIIIKYIRDGIRRGKFRPGQRLPTRAALERQFHTTAVTLQRAFARLREAGFIRCDGRRGTFVAEKPPSLFRYALIFPDVAAAGARNLFWQTLQQEVPAVSNRLGVEIVINFGLTYQTGESEDYRRLCRDIAEERFAGICFVTTPFMAKGTPLLNAAEMPRVAIMPHPPYPGVRAAISLEGRETLVRRALAWLRQRGRRRVAFITVPGLPTNLPQLAKEARFFCPDYWVQMGLQSEPEAAGRLAELLWQQPMAKRPDALVILDDNLTESVCAGLLRAGCDIGRDLEVVAHCNFPPPANPVVPIMRLGFDAAAVLTAAIKTLQELRQGGNPPLVVKIPPLFESEWQRGSDAEKHAASVSIA
ncbi:MAG: GntR family transcriptional regulator [Planctomycetota bacterium]|nr:GntR family transcriptional regulator [Planctomycetota bacterium]